MTRIALQRAVVFGCVACVACGRSEAVRDAAAVRDSAGVRIVENGAPELPPGSWSVADAPDLVIGADESDSMQVLFRVAGAVTLSDGRIVVAHQPAPMLRWFRPDGSYQTGTGRGGGGPGEFGDDEGAYITTIWLLPGDSVATWEHSQRRMQVFDATGRYVRYVRLELPPNMHPLSYPAVVGHGRDGFVASLTRDHTKRPVGERWRDSLDYIAYRNDGTYARSIALLPGFDRISMEFTVPGRPQPLRSDGRPPFAKPPIGLVTDNGFYYGAADRYEIARFALDGTLLQLIRKRGPNRAVTTALAAEDRERRTAAQRQSPSASRTVPGIDDMPYPDSLPAYRRIRADRDGSLWVQEYDVSGGTSATWSVFDADGIWMTDVALPQAWQILEIGRDYLLVLVTNELDVERIQRFRLTR